MLDVLDRELEKRGHRFVRHADDCNIHVRSRRAGERVMASVTRFLRLRTESPLRIRGLLGARASRPPLIRSGDLYVVRWPDERFRRQRPKAGAGWSGDQVRICAGGRGNVHSCRNGAARAHHHGPHPFGPSRARHQGAGATAAMPGRSPGSAGRISEAQSDIGRRLPSCPFVHVSRAGSLVPDPVVHWFMVSPGRA